MTDQEFHQLIKRYLLSELSEEEKQDLFAEYDRRRTTYEEWDSESMGEPGKVSSAIFQKVNERISKSEERGTKGRGLLYKIAAMVVLVSGLVFLFYLQNQQPSPSIAKLNHTEVIMPGQDKAFLVTGDGKTVILNNIEAGSVIDEKLSRVKKVQEGEIAYESVEHARGRVDKEEVEYNTIQTPKGGQFRVTLSDGTKVWLNAHSSLTFPVKFSSQERTVELKGEAYFEVAQSSTPFYVKTNDEEVRVLGTHFNVQNYENEPASKVTLMEGSVLVMPSLSKDKAKVLQPGQQAYLTDKLEVKTVDVTEVLAWKNGFFQFNKASLEAVMRHLSRWYNFEVKYEGVNPSSRSFSGKISRDVELDYVLEMLGYLEVDFIIKGRTLTIKPNSQLKNK